MISVGFIQNGRIYFSHVDCDLSDVDFLALSEDYIATMVNLGDFTKFPSTIGELNKFVKIRNYCNPNKILLEDIKDLKNPTIVFKDGYLKVIINGEIINPEDLPTKENRREYLERKFINGTMIKYWSYGYLDIFGKEVCSLETSAMSEFKFDQFVDLKSSAVLLVSTKEVEDYDGFAETEITLTLVAGSFFK